MPFQAVSVAERERLLLAPYAMHSVDSAGRKHPEAVHPYRGPYQRDRDRVVHSTAYRRLSGKTQVFTRERGDFHRTRMTHTHEVASVSRTLGRALGLNEDLIEALALMHDLGHPPFGHAGEDVLDACLRDDGGFSHNRQALRIVEWIEQRYPEFPGLNLSLEILEGQQTRAEKSRRTERPLVEAQVVDAADSVAYDTHDVDDALQLGLLTLQELQEISLWRDTVDRVRQRYADLDDGELRRASLHELIDRQASDLIETTKRRIAAFGVDSVAAVRKADVVVQPSDDLAEQKLQLERFLYQRVYRHPEVVAGRIVAQGQLREMFAGFCERPEWMPASFVERAATFGVPRSVGDYIAGMTDHFAQHEFQRLFAGGAAV